MNPDLGDEDTPESSDPFEEAQGHEVRPNTFIEEIGAHGPGITVKITIKKHKNPRLYQWLLEGIDDNPIKKGRGSSMPRILEASLMLMMEWRMGLLEIRRKIGGGSIGGNGEDSPKQTPVKVKTPHPLLKEIATLTSDSDLQQGRAQMRKLAENKTGMQTDSSVGSDETPKTALKVAPKTTAKLDPIDLSGTRQPSPSEDETSADRNDDQGWTIDDLASRTEAF